MGAARGTDPNHSHAVRFAVADENRSVPVDKDAVRTRHLTRQRIAIRPVSFGAGSRYQFNRLLANVDHPDRMAFGVGQIDVAVRRDAQTFRAGQRGQLSRSSVASESFLSCSRDVMNRSRLHIKPINGIAFAQREPHISAAVEVNRARAVEWGPGDLRAVGRRFFLPRSGECRDHACLHINLADAVVEDVADVKIAARVELDAVRLIERRLRGRAAVARKSGLARSRDGRNDPRPRVNAADDMIEPFDEKHIALFVETDFVRFIERGSERGPAVARIAFLARARDGRDHAVPVNSADGVVHRVADIKRAVRPSRDAERIVEPRLRGLSAVARVARLPDSGEGFDLRLRRRRSSRRDRRAETEDQRCCNRM